MVRRDLTRTGLVLDPASDFMLDGPLCLPPPSIMREASLRSRRWPAEPCTQTLQKCIAPRLPFTSCAPSYLVAVPHGNAFWLSRPVTRICSDLASTSGPPKHHAPPRHQDFPEERITYSAHLRDEVLVEEASLKESLSRDWSGPRDMTSNLRDLHSSEVGSSKMAESTRLCGLRAQWLECSAGGSQNLQSHLVVGYGWKLALRQ